MKAGHDEYALAETNLYDAGSGKLIWSASSDQDQIKSSIRVMVNAMAEQRSLR
jgi:hypothetical protein